MTGTSLKRRCSSMRNFNTDRKASYLEELTAGASDADPARKNGYDYTEYPIPQTKKMWRDSVYACADMQDCNLQNCMAAGSCFVGMNLDRSVAQPRRPEKVLFQQLPAALVRPAPRQPHLFPAAEERRLRTRRSISPSWRTRGFSPACFRKATFRAQT